MRSLLKFSRFSSANHLVQAISRILSSILFFCTFLQHKDGQCAPSLTELDQATSAWLFNPRKLSIHRICSNGQRSKWQTWLSCRHWRGVFLSRKQQSVCKIYQNGQVASTLTFHVFSAEQKRNCNRYDTLKVRTATSSAAFLKLSFYFS
jgi:hypothetical protein